MGDDRGDGNKGNRPFLTPKTESRLERWSRIKRQPVASPEPTFDPQLVAASPEANPELIGDAPEISDPGDDDRDFNDSVDLTEQLADLGSREALRTLWRSDPVLANLDGLVDYGDDFTDSGLVRGVLSTAYRVGTGFLHAGDDTDKRPVQQDLPVAASEPGLTLCEAEDEAHETTETEVGEVPEMSLAEPQESPRSSSRSKTDPGSKIGLNLESGSNSSLEDHLRLPDEIEILNVMSEELAGDRAGYCGGPNGVSVRLQPAGLSQAQSPRVPRLPGFRKS